MGRFLMKICFFLLASTLISCESKFVEDSPDLVTVEGVTLDDRIFEKAEADKRIEQIVAGAEQIKRIMELIRKIKAPKSYVDTYTPIDFLIDLNEELKSKVPSGNGGKFIRRGQIALPIGGLTEECEKVDTLLESNIVQARNDFSTIGKSEGIGENLVYSIKSCYSNNEYVEIFVAQWVGDLLILEFKKENLVSFLKDVFLSELQKNSKCKVSTDSRMVLDSVVCTNLSVELTESEVAHLDLLQYSNSEYLRLKTIGSILEHSKKKAEFRVEVNRDGKVESTLEKVKD